MAKDVNIHVKTEGADQTKEQLAGVAGAAQGIGDKTAESQLKAGKATTQTTKKMSGMGNVLGRLRNQVVSFVSAWLGLQAVQKIISWIIEKLERMVQLQQQIYEKSVTLTEIGQALEFQTGTVGQQQYWAEQAIKLQKAGPLSSAQVAQQMLISADIAFAAQGGIKDDFVLSMLKIMAPFVGAAGLGPEEVAKVFEFAGTAGIPLDVVSYLDYFAKLQAGYTASKATDFGQFMLGLQKGGTAYMAQGGTLAEAISIFSGARSVMANEALAATAVEQIARLSSGGYEKPRMAIEQALGVRWEQMTMDQRTAALLQYAGNIPESQRAQVLAEQGFPMELITQIGKMVGPEAQATIEATRTKVTGAEPVDIKAQTEAYQQSILAGRRRTEAEIAEKQLEAGPAFASWQERLRKARAELDILIAQGKDRKMIADSLEAYVIALEDLMKEMSEYLKTMPEGPEKERLEVDIRNIKFQLGFAEYFDLPHRIFKTLPRYGQYMTEEFKDIQQSQPVIIHNHNDINNYPRTGEPAAGPRSSPEDIY